MLIQQLPHNNVDIIGDIHGEIDALEKLLELLGYNSDGLHPENRHLVFVGDLVDRGPDSIAVIRLVKRLIDNGKAYCILGNHELNLLIPDRNAHWNETQNDIAQGLWAPPLFKHGNYWFHGQIENMQKNTPEHPSDPDFFHPQALATKEHQLEIRRFLKDLPLALESDCLQVVHGCWMDSAVQALRDLKVDTALEAYQYFEEHADEASHQSIVKKYADAFQSFEESTAGNLLRNKHQYQKQYPSLEKMESSLKKQNGNPVKVLTSGIERPLNLHTEAPFNTGGRDRFLSRIPWWKEYNNPRKTTIFGHYWRLRQHSNIQDPHYMFTEAHNLWLENDHNTLTMCVDFSVGARYSEREKKIPLASSEKFLAALRIKDIQGSLQYSLIFDDGYQTKVD